MIASNLLDPSEAPGPVFFEAHDITSELDRVDVAAIVNPASPALAGRFMGQLNVDFTMPGLSAKKDEPAPKVDAKPGSPAAKDESKKVDTKKTEKKDDPEKKVDDKKSDDRKSEHGKSEHRKSEHRKETTASKGSESGSSDKA